jgi:hypothetical protein
MSPAISLFSCQAKSLTLASGFSISDVEAEAIFTKIPSGKLS